MVSQYRLFNLFNELDGINNILKKEKNKYVTSLRSIAADEVTMILLKKKRCWHGSFPGMGLWYRFENNSLV